MLQVHVHTICQSKAKYCFHKRKQVFSSFLEIICQISHLDKKVALHSTTILLRHENNLRKQIKAIALYIIKFAEFVYHPVAERYTLMRDDIQSRGLMIYECISRHRRVIHPMIYQVCDLDKKLLQKCDHFCSNFCERDTKRIQNPNGFIFQKGFTLYRKWVQI